MTSEAQFDLVVVGAGSAGCVLADRLSASGELAVLLLEAGGEDRSAEIRVPAAYPRLFGTEFDWGFCTTPQPALDDRVVAWPRGRTLGGSSSLNAQIWTRGAASDFDRWSRDGCAGWSAADLEPCFRRAERWLGQASEAGALGTDGAVALAYLRDPSPASAAFVQACAQAGIGPLDASEFTDPDGAGPVRVTQHNGRRWNSADAYLRPARSRPNLTVRTGVELRRVVVRDGRAVGVEVAGADGVEVIGARREVVLAAGAVGSPVALLRSGIGPAAELRAAGVEPVLDRPEVGRNLADHLYVPVSRRSATVLSPGVGDQREHARRYLAGRRGPLASNLAEAVAFVRLQDGPGPADLELMWTVVPGLADAGSNGVSVAAVLLEPESRGSVRLGDGGAPLIEAGYLSDPGGRDLRLLLEGVRLAHRVLAASALAPHVEPEPEPDGAALEQLCRATAQTLYHPTGTCRMGADADAVVDPRLRVRGVQGLRVVDASVLPTIPRGHTHAVVTAVAERAADLILADLRPAAAPAGPVVPAEPVERRRVLEQYRRHVGTAAAQVAEALELPVEVRSAGQYVWDADDRRYLQCGGYGVFILGHRPAAVVQALHRQLDVHPVAGRMLLSAELAQASEALVSVAPRGLQRVFFACTGTEAVEAALKLARAGGRRRVVAATGGFHGKTIGALSVTDRLSFRAPFKPLLPDVDRVPFGELDALRSALQGAPRSAVILEPVQGEGGVRIPPTGYLAAVRELVTEHDGLLIVDEIQTGLGRLGRWWGWPEDAAPPDLLLVGKALGGGCVPVSAVLATPEAFRPLDRNPRLHSSTFSGYPLAMAAVTATLTTLREERVPERAAALGAGLLELLRTAARQAPDSVVAEVRGSGLLLGVEFTRVEFAGRFTTALIRAGVLPTSSLGADTVVRFTPSVLLSEQDLELLRAACESAFAALSDPPAPAATPSAVERVPVPS